MSCNLPIISSLNQYITGNISTNCQTILNTYNKTICLNHTINVANKVVELANQFDLNPDKLEQAAYLHDISVVLPRENYVSICNEYDIEVIEIEKELPILLHQKGIRYYC